MAVRSKQHMRVDQHRKHARGSACCKESDAAHVGGKIKNIAGAPESGQALGFLGEVGLNGSGCRKPAIPESGWLDVDRPHVGKSVLDQVAHQGTAYEPPPRPRQPHAHYGPEL
jgi:hypothetical protein